MVDAQVPHVGRLGFAYSFPIRVGSLWQLSRLGECHTCVVILHPHAMQSSIMQAAELKRVMRFGSLEVPGAVDSQESVWCRRQSGECMVP